MSNRFSLLTCLAAAMFSFQLPARPQQTAPPGALPLLAHSIRFAVIGDSGTGDTKQYAVAAQMEAYRQRDAYDFAIMLGDNIYGGHSARDFTDRFEKPYKPLLDAGVKFYASLGNHDDPQSETLYKPFNMDGHRYYTINKGPVEFFVLDSNYMDPVQLQWLQRQLADSTADWKIAYFHHPLFSDGKFHGPDLDLRARLMPLFQKYGVDVVLSGHDHVYERVKPQSGIYFFVLGDSGQLRYKDLRPAQEMAAGSDTLQDFMLVEIAGNQFFYQTISGAGVTVDSGVIAQQTKSASQPDRPR